MKVAIVGELVDGASQKTLVRFAQERRSGFGAFGGGYGELFELICTSTRRRRRRSNQRVLTLVSQSNTNRIPPRSDARRVYESEKNQGTEKHAVDGFAIATLSWTCDDILIGSGARASVGISWEAAKCERIDPSLSSAAQFKASHDARQQIADGAIAYFHAVFSFAETGQDWAARILAEFARSATSALEAIIAQRPREPMKPVPLWQSPKDRAKNDAHTLSADSSFAAVRSVFREERELPVLIRRHAKAFNARKLKLTELVRLGSGLDERVGSRRYRNPDKPLNRFLDRHIRIIQANPVWAENLPSRHSKSGCRKWALRMLEIFEENNGPAARHPLFGTVLRNGPPTEKGKRGAIRDAVQDALFRRQNRG